MYPHAHVYTCSGMHNTLHCPMHISIYDFHLHVCVKHSPVPVLTNTQTSYACISIMLTCSTAHVYCYVRFLHLCMRTTPSPVTLLTNTYLYNANVHAFVQFSRPYMCYIVCVQRAHLFHCSYPRICAILTYMHLNNSNVRMYMRTTRSPVPLLACQHTILVTRVAAKAVILT